MYNKDQRFYPQVKTYVMDISKDNLTERFLLNAHNLCIIWENRSCTLNIDPEKEILWAYVKIITSMVYPGARGEEYLCTCIITEELSKRTL